MDALIWSETSLDPTTFPNSSENHYEGVCWQETYLLVTGCVIAAWLFILVYITLQPNVDFHEKWNSISIWTIGAISCFDICSDSAFAFYANDNDAEGYFNAILAILFISFSHFIITMIMNMPILLQEPLVTVWKSNTTGNLFTLIALFFMSCFSPVYFDLLLTSQIDFPIFPPHRRFMLTSKLLHVLFQNVPSMIVVTVYLTSVDVNALALASIISSILTAFILLFTVWQDMQACLQHKELHHVQICNILKKKTLPKTYQLPTRRKLTVEVQQLAPDNATVKVWYTSENKEDFELHVCIYTYNLMNKKEKETMKRMINRGLRLMHMRIENTLSVLPAVFDSMTHTQELTHSDTSWMNIETPTVVLQPSVSPRKLLPNGSSANFESAYLNNENESWFCPPHLPLEAQITGGSIMIEFFEDQDIELNLSMTCIGKGAFGKVYIGLFRGAKCASKQTKGIENYEKENELFKKVSMHPNVCRYYGVCECGADVFIVMDYYEHGSLHDVIKKEAFTMTEKTLFCLDLAKGLWHLHCEKVLHGDLALRNVLVCKVKKIAVIADFGQSCRYPCTEEKKLISVRWASPELLCTNKYSHESDVWALGVTFWEIFTDGEKPYKNMKNAAVISRLQCGTLRPTCDPEWPISPVLQQIFEPNKKTEICGAWLHQTLQGVIEEGRLRALTKLDAEQIPRAIMSTKSL